MELKQQLKLAQQLVMTPQLQQAIKLLQLSRLELTDLIQQEINENPVLDESSETEGTEKESQENLSDNPVKTESDLSEGKADFDWQNYVDKSIKPSTGSGFRTGESEDFEPIITKKASFADHLLWQLHLHNLNDQQMEIGEYIIGNLDRDGYLQTGIEEIAFDTGADKELVEEVGL